MDLWSIEEYRGLQVGWHKKATRVCACEEFSINNPHQNCAHARILIAIFLQTSVTEQHL